MLTPKQLLAVARWVYPRLEWFVISALGWVAAPEHDSPSVDPPLIYFNPLADTTEGKAQLMDVWLKLLTCDKIYVSWGGYFVTTQLVPSPNLSDSDYRTFNCVNKDGSRRDAAAILEAASYAIEKGLVN